MTQQKKKKIAHEDSLPTYPRVVCLHGRSCLLVGALNPSGPAVKKKKIIYAVHANEGAAHCLLTFQC